MKNAITIEIFQEGPDFIARCDRLPLISGIGYSPQEAMKELCTAILGCIEISEEDNETLFNAWC